MQEIKSNFKFIEDLVFIYEEEQDKYTILSVEKDKVVVINGLMAEFFNTLESSNITLNLKNLFDAFIKFNNEYEEKDVNQLLQEIIFKLKENELIILD